MSYESINKNRKATRNGGFFVIDNYVFKIYDEKLYKI